MQTKIPTKQTSFCVKLLPLLSVINIFSRKKKPNAFSGQTMALSSTGLGGGKGWYIVSCVTFLLELEALFFSSPFFLSLLCLDLSL
jgi:hypothetical protein